jgi:hypothetical protein
MSKVAKFYMSDSKFKYIVRLGLDPEFEVEARIAEIRRFCVEGSVEEIMLQILPEELSTGHPTEQELEKSVEMSQKLKSALDSVNVDVSIQPWCTLYHNYRGRYLRQGQDFRLLVGENGNQNPIAVCPLCENWQKYICNTFELFAREVSPRTLWIEDDFRLHNHNPFITGWGGCFCDEHLRRFSEMVGQDVTRQELLGNILAKGKPHPWREKWILLSWQSILEPARKIRQTVDRVNDKIDLALMCSMPDKHSVEGRQWDELADVLRNNRPFVIRPHLHPYTEEPAISNAPVFARQTIDEFNCPLTIYPELECSPRGGVYTKSYRFMNWQCETSALFGSDGITINCFDVLGNGTIYYPDIGKKLAEKKQSLML